MVEMLGSLSIQYSLPMVGRKYLLLLDRLQYSVFGGKTSNFHNDYLSPTPMNHRTGTKGSR